MHSMQPGILGLLPQLTKYMLFDAVPGSDVAAVLKDLAATADGAEIIFGLGRSLVLMLGEHVPGLRHFPVHVGPGEEVSSAPAAL